MGPFDQSQHPRQSGGKFGSKVAPGDMAQKRQHAAPAKKVKLNSVKIGGGYKPGTGDLKPGGK
jgi:hypothetical protein